MQFHILSFEGPDGYARAGGIASRISGLSEALAEAGFETHLWFVGDPDSRQRKSRRLSLHRWCQWISHYHPAGVYDGEEGKRADYAASLPPFLLREYLLPHLVAAAGPSCWPRSGTLSMPCCISTRFCGGRAARPRDHLLERQQHFRLRPDRLEPLEQAAVITTVSRYMKHHVAARRRCAGDSQRTRRRRVSRAPDRDSRGGAARAACAIAPSLTKVARWDPDKRWMLAIETVAVQKSLGWQPLLLARGGLESHGAEVMARAATMGLRVVQRTNQVSGVHGLLQALEGTERADVVELAAPLDAESCRVLFRGSAAVLANSGREPFGLVGLETMAAGGVACTGSTGEDYAIPGQNALVLETADPWEFVTLFNELRTNPVKERALRRAARATAERYAWSQIVRRLLLPRLQLAAEPAQIKELKRA